MFKNDSVCEKPDINYLQEMEYHNINETILELIAEIIDAKSINPYARMKMKEHVDEISKILHDFHESNF